MIHYKNSRTLFFCQGAKGSASLIAEGTHDPGCLACQFLGQNKYILPGSWTTSCTLLL